ncbi:MAG: MarR family transcriptional regulator [Dongiaceae bacterium]
MPARAVSDLEDHLGYWLRIVSNAVSHGFARKLAARDITGAEWVVLRKLYDVDAVPPSRLAERMGMTKGAITRLADRLIAKRLVERAANPDDRRAQTLALTAAGRRLVPELAAIADGNDAAFFGVLDDRQRAALGRLMRRIVEGHRLSAIPTE